MDHRRNMQRILYLDYDGVLHDEEVYSHIKQGIYLRTPGRTLFEWEPILHELIMPHKDIRIVLSTSWVPMRSFSYAKSRLSEPLKSRVIGSTFHSGHMEKAEFLRLPRGVQIAQDASRRCAASWIAIDDDDEQWPEQLRNNLVLTNGATGINDRSVQITIAAKLLENQ